MNAVRKRVNLNRQLKTLNERTDQILNRLAAFPDETLNAPPGPGVWSVMQILTHLMLSERLSLEYVRKKLSFNPQLKKAGLMATGRHLLLRWSQQLPFKYHAPKGVQTENLPEFCSLAELKDRWLSDRQKLHQFLSEVDDELLTRELYRHPVAGRMSLVQMVSFYNVHLQRHLKQIESRIE